MGVEQREGIAVIADQIFARLHCFHVALQVAQKGRLDAEGRCHDDNWLHNLFDKPVYRVWQDRSGLKQRSVIACLSEMCDRHKNHSITITITIL